MGDVTRERVLSSTQCSLSTLHVAFFAGMLRTRVGRDRAFHPDVDLWVSCGSGVRCFEVRVVCGRGSDVQSVVR